MNSKVNLLLLVVVILTIGVFVYYNLSNSNEKVYKLVDNKLYIGDKLIDKYKDDVIEEENIFLLSDALVVGVCYSYCDYTLFNLEGNEIGNLRNLINKKYKYDFFIDQVIDNSLYIFSRDYLVYDYYSLCEFNDNEMVEGIEKFAYLGNGKFANSVIILESNAGLLKNKNEIVCPE